MRKDCIVPTNGRTSLLVFFSSVIHPSKTRLSCQKRPSHPHRVPLVRIIQHVNIDWSWLNQLISTFVPEIFSYLSKRLLTLCLTLLSSLSLKPLKRVDPPDSAMLEYNFLLVSIGQSWMTLSTSSSTDFLYR